MSTPYGTLARWIPDQRYSLIVTALVWTLMVLMIVPDGFDYQAVVAGQTPTSGSLVSRLLWLGLLGGATIVVLWRASLAWMLLRILNPWLMLFVLLALASVLWSIDPVLTVRRDIRLVTIVMVAIAFAMVGWHPGRMQRLLRPILTWILLGSIVWALVAPHLAIHQESSPELANAWRGLTNHKNTFGALCCITLLLWLHGGVSREVHWLKALAGWTLASACLLLSRSATSLIASVLGSVLLVLMLCSPRNFKPFTALMIGLMVLFLILYSLALLQVVPGLNLLLAPITAVTDMDTSFTGRRYIWNIIAEHVSQNPLLGTGYAAYWAGPNPTSPSYEFILRMGSFYPGSAHNGYLEIINDLGWVGMLCLLGYLFSYLSQALRIFLIERNQGSLYLVLLIQQLIANLSESHWLNVLSVSFVITMFATAGLARLLLELRLRAHFGNPQLNPLIYGARRPLPALALVPLRLHSPVLAPRA